MKRRIKDKEGELSIQSSNLGKLRRTIQNQRRTFDLQEDKLKTEISILEDEVVSLKEEKKLEIDKLKGDLREREAINKSLEQDMLSLKVSNESSKNNPKTLSEIMTEDCSTLLKTEKSVLATISNLDISLVKMESEAKNCVVENTNLWHLQDPLLDEESYQKKINTLNMIIKEQALSINAGKESLRALEVEKEKAKKVEKYLRLQLRQFEKSKCTLQINLKNKAG